MSEVKKETGIARAITAALGQCELATALGVTQQAVSDWHVKGYVPLERAREIEALYGIPRAQLISPRIAELMDLSPVAPNDLTAKD